MVPWSETNSTRFARRERKHEIAEGMGVQKFCHPKVKSANAGCPLESKAAPECTQCQAHHRPTELAGQRMRLLTSEHCGTRCYAATFALFWSCVFLCLSL